MFWITDRLGTVAENEPCDPDAVIVNVTDLNDGANNPKAIRMKLERTLTLLHDPHARRIVIQCRAGISRSPTIAAATLSLYENIDFDTALNEVLRKVPRFCLNYDLVDSCRKALGKMKQNFRQEHHPRK